MHDFDIGIGFAESPHTAPSVCPPGNFEVTAGSEACVSSHGVVVGGWVLIDRNCGGGDCLEAPKYLDTGLHSQTSTTEGTLARSLMFVTDDWNRGEPYWSYVGGHEAPVVAERGVSSVPGQRPIQAILIAREYDVGATPLRWTELDIMESDDVDLELTPSPGATAMTWYLGENGAVPPANQSQLFGSNENAIEDLVEAMQMLGLRSRLIRLRAETGSVRVRTRSDELAALTSIPGVMNHTIDRSAEPTSSLASAVPHQNGDQLTAVHGAEGQGFTVDILDSGIETNHPFFGGAATESCLRTYRGADDVVYSNPYCEQPCGTHNGRVLPWESKYLCSHGNHVTGIVMGRSSVHGALRGVAPQAWVHHIRVATPGSSWGWGLSWSSARTLARAASDGVNDGIKIAALNYSAGTDDTFITSENPNADRERDLRNLLRLGVAPVTSAGNTWCVGTNYQLGVGKEAPSYIIVANSTRNDEFDCSSKTAPFVDLAAVGHSVESADHGGMYGSKSGTSMAAPMVSGAFAALNSLRPECSPHNILDALVGSGTPVTETRTSPSFSIPRIDLSAAAGALLLSRCRPEPPQDVEVVAVGSHDLMVRWDDVASNESGYEVRATEIGTALFGSVEVGRNHLATRDTPSQSTAATVAGLSPGTRYLVEVRAFRDAGAAREYSTWIEASSGPEPEAPSTVGCTWTGSGPNLQLECLTAPPDLLLAPIYDSGVTATTLTSVQVGWRRAPADQIPQNAKTVLGARAVLVGGGDIRTVDVAPSPVLNHLYQATFAGLKPGRYYHAYVRLRTQDGWSPATIRGLLTSSGPTIPAPTHLRAERVRETTVGLAWIDQARDVTLYEVQKKRPFDASAPAPCETLQNPASCWQDLEDVPAPAPPMGDANGIRVLRPDLHLGQTVGYTPGYRLRACTFLESPPTPLVVCSAWATTDVLEDSL